ncbi:deoxynucleoside kinase [Flavobacteriales bacterium]|jgi:deoxyguanosine kinase|nr:deoxynucleoside kinase [Flavobacteriales bacterium]
MEPYPYIVVEGNIGSGKTTLVQKLSAYLNARAFYEEFSDNPFLPKFYSDPEKHAFPLELSFLAERYHQLKNELNSRDLFHKSIISDYYLSKSLIFAEINLPEDEFNLYNSLFSIIHQKLPKPSLYIYLYSDVDRLQINIKARGRAYEMEIKDSYLAQIQESYLLFINQQTDFPVLLLNTTKIDFVNSVSDFESIVSCLNKEYSKGVHRIML